MRWKLLDISDISSIYKLPRKVGFEHDGKNRAHFYFSYVNPVARTNKKNMPYGHVLVEAGSNRVVSVLLNSSFSEGNCASAKMRETIYGLFAEEGGIDSDEQKFLDLIDSEVINSGAFSR